MVPPSMGDETAVADRPRPASDNPPVSNPHRPTNNDGGADDDPIQASNHHSRTGDDNCRAHDNDSCADNDDSQADNNDCRPHDDDGLANNDDGSANNDISQPHDNHGPADNGADNSSHYRHHPALESTNDKPNHHITGATVNR